MNSDEPLAEYKYLVNGAFYQLTIKNVKMNTGTSEITLKGVYCDKDSEYNFYFIENRHFVNQFDSNGVSLLHCDTGERPCNVYKMFVEMEWESITVALNVLSKWKLSIKPFKSFISNGSHGVNPFMSTRLDIELRPLQLSKEVVSDKHTYNALTSVATNCVIAEDEIVDDIVKSIDDTQEPLRPNVMQEHNTNTHSQNVEVSPESPYVNVDVDVESIPDVIRSKKGKKKKTKKPKPPKLTYARQILAAIRHVLHNNINKDDVNIRGEVNKVVKIYRNNIKNDKATKTLMENIINKEIETWENTLTQKKQNGGKPQPNKKYVMYCKVRYLLRKGERGGEYIIVKGKKVYASKFQGP
jgi:hypothetical protein